MLSVNVVSQAKISSPPQIFFFPFLPSASFFHRVNLFATGLYKVE